ncbi:DUF1493 family protein [Alcanivorax profundi]|uniref:DUF1493 family protein n=1 Tax=Alcanivorax profundi TaxID=2338368 RepID=A0A418XUE3_9GAMM|nr:DUF1493 family protein [Alcanivorax profundi]RJG16357.1 DUF1493 family protein [Alcanivorax profundi]
MNIEEIYSFLAKEIAIESEKLHPDVDLTADLGVEGDDFSELIEAFAENYHVDMSSYRWYFHHREEGWSLGALFFKPPYMQVQRIQVTPEILLHAARMKKWSFEYPSHQVSESRLDIQMNIIILVGLGVTGALMWLLGVFSA